MPEQWMYDVMGDEARPRPGYEDELANELQREWRGSRTPWRAIAWSAAAAALLIGVVAVVAQDDNKQIAPADTVPTVATTQPQPTVTPAPTTTPDTTATTDATTPTTGPGQSTTIYTADMTGVELYLASLANRDYDAAAQLLNEGGLSLEDRADIRPLFRPEFGLVAGQTNRAAVAAALEKWCARALCVPASELTRVNDRFISAMFSYEFDTPVTTLFTEYVFEGQEGVTGLPPLMPPTGYAQGLSIVECPRDAAVDRVAWADLDGDGWLEQLVGRSIGDAGDPEDGVRNYVINTCGTELQVAPFEITGDGLAIYPVNAGVDGADTLLIGFLEGAPNGGVYVFDGQAIVPLQGFDGPATWAMFPPIASDPAESVGCAVLVDGQPPVLVNRYYGLTGSFELTTASSMDLTTVDMLTGYTTEETFDLPGQLNDATEALMSNCNGLPVRVD